MINHDMIIGISVGSVYGYLFRPIFQFFFRFTVRIFKKSLLPTGIVLIFIGLFPSICIALFFLTVLLFKPLIFVWKIFISFFLICLFIGMGVYAISHRKQISKWD